MSVTRWVSDLGPTNPIILRIVANGSRRTRHLWIRSGFLALLMVALLFGMIGQTSSLRELAQRGATAFTMLSFAEVALICVLTPLFMAGAIAQEANPRTWEIMLVTPLNRVQIVIGNLMGRLFFVLALLIAALPLMMSTQFFGGVPPTAVWGSFMISASTAVVVGAVAVALSITRSAGKRSVFVFYSTVVIYLFATWAADSALRVATSAGSATQSTTIFTPINPFLAMESLLLPATYAPMSLEQPGWIARAWMVHPARSYCVVTLTLSLMLMVMSTFAVRAMGARTVRTPWWRRWMQKPTADGRESMRVSHNPIAWRESQLRGTSLAALTGRWGFVGVGILGGLLLPVLHRTGALSMDGFRLALQTVVAAESVVIVLTALNMSATAVSREREDGSLDIILTTPIQPGPYIAGKLRGIIQFLAPMLMVPTVTLAASAVYVLANGMGVAGGSSVSVASGTATLVIPAMLPEGALEYPLGMLAFTSFAVMIGLQWSIKSKGTIGSAVGAVFATGVAGLVLGLCGMAAGRSIPAIGAFMNALTPINLVAAIVTPEAVADEVLQQGVATYRIFLAAGAVTAGALGVGVVWAMHSAMKKTFMFTVRKLAGTA